MRTVILFLMFFNFNAMHSQCVEDSFGNCIAKGKYKKFKTKNSFGIKREILLKTGLWTYYNEDAEKIAEGKFVVKSNISYEDGEWLYFNSNQVLFVKRLYKNGALISSIFYDTGNVSIDKTNISVKCDAMKNVTVVEKFGQLKKEYKTAFETKVNVDKVVLKQPQITYQINTYPEEANMDSLFLINQPNTLSLLNVPIYSSLINENLVQNPSFELESAKMEKIPEQQIKVNKEEFATNWFSARETPDIHNKDNNCYGGFRVLGVNFEVLGNKLNSELEAGKTYCLQFKLKLKSENSHAFNGVSVIAESEKLYFDKKSTFKSENIVLQTHPSIVLGCRSEWMTISGQFVAKGGEKYLYFSNFTDSQNLKIYSLNGSNPFSFSEIYYYLDDVVLKAIDETEACPCNVKYCDIEFANTKKSIQIKPIKGEKFVLKNIQFELDKSVLLESSYNTLDSLVELMRTYPNMVVEIGGHTDDLGSLDRNLALSMERAESVRLYLIENGIDKTRVTSKGYSSSQPLIENTSETNRKLNRRVEIKVLEI